MALHFQLYMVAFSVHGCFPENVQHSKLISSGQGPNILISGGSGLLNLCDKVLMLGQYGLDKFVES